MKAPMIAMILAVVAVGCDGRPARDPSYGTTTTTAAPSEARGNPTSATVHANDADRRPTTAANQSARGGESDPASRARAIEQQRPDGSITTWEGSGNTRQETLADLNAKQGPEVFTERKSGDHGSVDRADRADRADRRGAAQEQTKTADKSKNEPARPGGAVGALDQGNSSSETKITADIRRQLVVSGTLSLSSKNVKVITTGSKVTLRGKVKSEKEKVEIEGIAKATNGVTEVDSQLEVEK